MTKVNINDPQAWQSIDWDEPAPLNIRSDSKVEVSRKSKLTAIAQWNNPVSAKKKLDALHAVYETEEWQQNVDAANKKKAKDPDWRKVHQASYTPESNKRRSESLKETCKKPEVKAQRSKKSADQWNDDSYRNKMQRCFKTNLGVFASITEASLAHGITNFHTAMKRKKNIEAGWCYITREEYDRLKK